MNMIARMEKIHLELKSSGLAHEKIGQVQEDIQQVEEFFYKKISNHRLLNCLNQKKLQQGNYCFPDLYGNS